MADPSDLIGVSFEDESGKEFEITDVGAHPNFNTARIVARTPDYEVRGGGDDTIALDARDVQERFANDEWDIIDDKGLF